MAGEMTQSEVTQEAFPLHFAIANKYGGTVHAFDVYQGPYINIPGAKLWIGEPEKPKESGMLIVWNETLDKQSSQFWPYWKDDARSVEEALKAAEEALTPVTETPKLTRYHFSFGDSTEGPIGFCAAVWAETPEEAVTMLRERVEGTERSIDEDDDVPTDGQGEGIEYCTVYFGGAEAITAAGIDETEGA